MARLLKSLPAAGLMMIAFGAVAPQATAQLVSHTTPYRVMLAFDFVIRPPVSPTLALPAFLGAYVSSANVTVPFFNDGLANAPTFRYPDAGITLTFNTFADVPSSRLDFNAAANHNYPTDQKYYVVVTLDGVQVAKYIEGAVNGGGDYSFKLPYMSAGTHSIHWSPAPINANTRLDFRNDFYSVVQMELTTP